MADSSQFNNPCEIPYMSSDGKQLNVYPKECVLNDKTWKYLYKAAKIAILHFKLHQILQKVHNDKSYENLYLISQGIAAKINGRVVITLPDGHVVIDTCKGDGNTYENYINDNISENHNTRVSIFQAQCDTGGVGYEKKYSSTIGKTEAYIAVRLGKFRNNAGTLRLSVSITNTD